ncbi:MAG TPA: hypothetical protein VFU29_05545 [Chitinophagaceae bacterium]|nr:hypothetical protein [Chitinophagaceae bacterium]
MKKIILAVILLAATGDITYYLLQNKKQNAATNFKREEALCKNQITASNNHKKV